MKQLKLFTSVFAFLLLTAIQAQNVIPVPPHSSSFTGNSRGYWFTAPCDMVITGISAPADYSTGAQTIQLVRFQDAPQVYPTLTTTFTTLFYQSGIADTGFVDVNIPVYEGDLIGIMAVRDNGSASSVTSYTTALSPVASSLNGHTIQLQRLGHQGNIISGPAPDFWTEVGSPIGRAEIRYEVAPPVIIPIPPHGTNYSGNSRGYWFEAPCDFKLTGVRAPADYSTNAQSIHLVKFNTIPPDFTANTTDFVTLYYGSNISDTNFVGLDIDIIEGDIIGVITVRDDGSGGSVTSYTTATAPVASSILGNPVNLRRLIFQGNIITAPSTNFSNVEGSYLGRAELRYEPADGYTYNPGSPIANSFPFNSSSSNKRQWIYNPTLFHCAPAGYITRIYFQADAPANGTFTSLLLRMGSTTLNVFPDNTYITTLDTVHYSASINLVSGTNNWVPIDLDVPFYFDASTNFILEASQEGYTSGFTIMQGTVVGTSLYGSSLDPTGTIQDRLAALKFDIMTDLDASLEGFVGISDSVCEGTVPVTVILKNNSPVTFTSATFNWEINSSAQPLVNWTGNLLPGEMTNVDLGTFLAADGTTYNIDVIVSEPNGISDIMDFNNSICLVNLFTIPAPDVNLGNDTIIGMNTNITLDAGPGTSYNWSTGENTQTIVVDSTGIGVGTTIIWVEVTNEFGCVGTDTIQIEFMDNTGMENFYNSADISIVPNPSDGMFDIQFNAFPEGEIFVEIFNLNGALVLNERHYSQSGSSVTIHANELPTGFYTLKVTNSRKTFVHKLVIEK
jgi:hypothetical protein